MALSFYIETYGCQMNKNDSELMADSMIREGFIRAEGISDARIAIYNTCSVRQHAEQRALARIRIGKKQIRERKGVIAVTGCMAQRTGIDLIKNRLADIVVGPYESPNIGQLVKIYLKENHRNIFLSQDADDFSERILTNGQENSDKLFWHKWVTITHGCENYCSYCIVPYVRGKLISFRSESILAYIKSLAEKNIKEITLLGQNVNQYGTDTGDMPFHKLLSKTAEIKGLVRINFITSHPKDFSEEIIRVIKDNENISRAIHLPLQSGSNKVLQMMNRNYSVQHYLDIIEKINRHLNNFSITTDLIVGFPGEDDTDYRETLKRVEQIRFDDAFMYAYSPRENTPSWNLKEKISKENKMARLENLITIQKKISKEKLSARINKTEKIIVERISKKSGIEVMGKTFLNHPVVLPGSLNDLGMALIIKIINLKGNTLQGIKIE